MKKSTKGYLFKVDDRGNYIITHEAIIGQCNIIPAEDDEEDGMDSFIRILKD